MPGLVQVGTVEQVHELGVIDVVIPGQRHQFADGFTRLFVFQAHGLLRCALVGVVGFQHGAKEVVLVAKVVVKHPLVDARLL